METPMRGRRRGRGAYVGGGSTRYHSEIYGGTKEAREWRKETKISEIVLEVTIWLKQKGNGQYKYDMNDAIPKLRDLLDIIQKNDQGASIINRFETELGGEEKTLTDISDDVRTLTKGSLQPFFHRPMINRYRGTFHVKIAIRSTRAMNRGTEQRNYLTPIFENYNRPNNRFIAYDPVQEIHQFKIGAFIGISSEFNEVDARKDIMSDALKIYDEEREKARAKKQPYSEFPVELKLIRSDLQAIDGNGQSSSVSVAWLHAGKKSAIIAEKLIQQYEELQERQVDGDPAKIVSRNLRVIRAPKSEKDIGLYDLVLSLKQNQLITRTTAVNYIHRVDQKVELLDGKRVALREVFLHIKDKEGKNIFRHVDKVKRGRGINLAYYRTKSEAATEAIENLTDELKKLVTKRSYDRDIVAVNNSGSRSNYIPTYNLDRKQTRTNNYANSVAFFTNTDVQSSEEQLDVKTIPARTLNQATASGMSWADTVKMIRPSNTTIQNNLTTTTTTVNQQINQIVLNQSDKEGKEILPTKSSVKNSMQVNHTEAESKEVIQDSIVHHRSGEITTSMMGSKSLLGFEEKMKDLQQLISKNETTSERRMEMIGTTIADLITSSDRRLTQVQTIGQIQTQACMLGIQELAEKMNIQLSTPTELLERATAEVSEKEKTTNERPNEIKDTPALPTQEEDSGGGITEDQKSAPNDGMDINVKDQGITKPSMAGTQDDQSQELQQLLTQLSPPAGSSGDGNF